LKHDANLGAVLVERGNAIRRLFVLAAMPCVLLAELKQNLVQLLDMVFADRKVLPRTEYEIHQARISSHLLLVAGGKGPDFEIRQQAPDLAIRKLAAFDACRRTDTLDRGDAAQGRQSIGRKRSQGAPCAFELVDPGDQAQDLRGNLNGVGSNHRTNTTPNYTH
jgi:hypothetical protein